MAASTSDIRDRAMGSLLGLAIGDALGMPSQTLNRASIRKHYGLIEDFVAPYPGHPVSHGLPAAAVTDDTEQALLLARRLVAEPVFDPLAWAQDLLAWEADVQRRGLRDLLGPSSKAALEAIGRGVDPGEAAKNGTTNGAAMRIAPVGVATPIEDVVSFVDAVETASRVTHNTGESIAAAAAVGAMVSARIAGADFTEGFACALQAAEEGQKRGYPNGATDIAQRIARAVELAGTGPGIEQFADAVGVSVASHESVPAAFGILRLSGDDVWKAAVMAANIGDDTDTIGAMAGAMAGAASGASALPNDKTDRLLAVNALALDDIVDGLLRLREGARLRILGAAQ